MKIETPSGLPFVQKEVLDKKVKEWKENPIDPMKELDDIRKYNPVIADFIEKEAYNGTTPDIGPIITSLVSIYRLLEAQNIAYRVEEK